MQHCCKDDIGIMSPLSSQHVPYTFTLSSYEFLTLWTLYHSLNAYCFSCCYDSHKYFSHTPSPDFFLGL